MGTDAAVGGVCVGGVGVLDWVRGASELIFFVHINLIYGILLPQTIKNSENSVFMGIFHDLRFTINYLKGA